LAAAEAPVRSAINHGSIHEVTFDLEVHVAIQVEACSHGLVEDVVLGIAMVGHLKSGQRNLPTM
jgi:hypothetical protein